MLLVAGCGSGGASTSNGAAAKGDPSQGRKLSTEKCTPLCHKPQNPFQAPLLPAAVKTRVKFLKDYASHVGQLKMKDKPRYEKYQAEIDAIAAETDPERQLELWWRSYLKNTTFDDSSNTMLQLVPPLKAEEMDHLIAYLFSLK